MISLTKLHFSKRFIHTHSTEDKTLSACITFAKIKANNFLKKKKIVDERGFQKIFVICEQANQRKRITKHTLCTKPQIKSIDQYTRSILLQISYQICLF